MKVLFFLFSVLSFFAGSAQFECTRDDSTCCKLDRKGNRQGFWKDFIKYNDYDSCFLFSSGYYIDDKMNGVIKVFRKNGKIASESNYRNDTLDGVAKNYYENGNVYEETTYKMGLRHGYQKIYYPSGALQRESQVSEDVTHGKCKLYYENGYIKMETNFIKGVKDGLDILYDSVLQKPIRIFLWKNGNLINEKYYCNGNFITDVSFNTDRNR